MGLGGRARGKKGDSGWRLAVSGWGERGSEERRTRGHEGWRAGGHKDSRTGGLEGWRTGDRSVRGLEGQRTGGHGGWEPRICSRHLPPGNGCARAARGAVPTLRRLRFRRTRRRASTQSIPCQPANGSTGQLCFPFAPCHLAHVSPPKARPSLPPSERARRYRGSSRRARRSRPTRARRGVPVGAVCRRLPRAGCAPRPNHN